MNQQRISFLRTATCGGTRRRAADVVVYDGGDVKDQHRDQQPRQNIVRGLERLEQGLVARHQVGQRQEAEPDDARRQRPSS